MSLSLRMVEAYSPTKRLTILLFCLFASTVAKSAVFQAPSAADDLTLVLNTDYHVQWKTDWPSVDLYVFCNGFQNGGVGVNGAQLLYGNYKNTSFSWRVAQVQLCDLSNLFHFMVEPASGSGGINSPSFHVIVQQSDVSETSPISSTSATSTAQTTIADVSEISPISSTSTSTTSTATATIADATTFTSTTETTPNPTSGSRTGILGVGLGVGLGSGLTLSAVLMFGTIWYRRKRRAQRLPINGYLTSVDTPVRLDHVPYEQSKIVSHKCAAEKKGAFELDSSSVRSQGRHELEGSR